MDNLTFTKNKPPCSLPLIVWFQKRGVSMKSPLYEIKYACPTELQLKNFKPFVVTKRYGNPDYQIDSYYLK